MNRPGLVLLLAVAAGAAVYGLVRFGLQDRTTAADVPSGADIAWLKAEFDLTDEQFAAIEDLHRDYGAVCGEHCANIAAAQARIEALRASGAAADRLLEARLDLESLEATCNAATRGHLRRVAALMPPEAGRRFLRMTEPHLASLPHDGARGLSR